MAGARWIVLAVAAMLTVSVATGCGGGKRPGGTGVAIVTPGARDDIDWARQTVPAVRALARGLGVGALVAEATDADARATLTRLAGRAQLVIDPYGGDRAVAASVAATTKVPALVFGDPRAMRPGLVGDVEVAWGEGAYAAGVIAMHAARERSVGIVVCADGTAADLANRYAAAAAYVAGARSVDPRAKVAYATAGSDGHATAAEAQQATGKLAARGIQMILSACGAATPGVMQGVQRAVQTVDGESQMVGLIGDKSTINRENEVVTSILVNPGSAFAQAARDVRSGGFGKHAYTLDLANGGITLLQSGRTPSDAYAAGVATKAQFAHAEIGLPQVSSEEALRSYLAQ